MCALFVCAWHVCAQCVCAQCVPGVWVSGVCVCCVCAQCVCAWYVCAQCVCAQCVWPVCAQCVCMACVCLACVCLACACLACVCLACVPIILPHCAILPTSFTSILRILRSPFRSIPNTHYLHFSTFTYLLNTYYHCASLYSPPYFTTRLSTSTSSLHFLTYHTIYRSLHLTYQAIHLCLLPSFPYLPHYLPLPSSYVPGYPPLPPPFISLPNRPLPSSYVPGYPHLPPPFISLPTTLSTAPFILRTRLSTSASPVHFLTYHTIYHCLHLT